MMLSRKTLLVLVIVFEIGLSFVLEKPAEARLLKDLLRKYRIRRDVTVIQRTAGEPCPVLLEDNVRYGADVGWGPSLFGNFYGGGNSMNPTQGFKSWGGNVGSNGMGIRRGLGIGVPIGARVMGPKQGNNCRDPTPAELEKLAKAQQLQQTQRSVPQSQAGNFRSFDAALPGGGLAPSPPQLPPPPMMQQPSQVTVVQNSPKQTNWQPMPGQPVTFYNPPSDAFRPFVTG